MPVARPNPKLTSVLLVVAGGLWPNKRPGRCACTPPWSVPQWEGGVLRSMYTGTARATTAGTVDVAWSMC
jgi:hypothetical protein